MIINVWDSLEQFSNDINKFISERADEPFFWLIIFTILFIIAVTAISKIGNK